MHTPARLRSAAGVTLIDLLVSVALSLVAMATVLAFHRAQLSALQDQARQLDLQTSTRAIVELFAREVRRAGLDPGCTKKFAMLADGSATQVRVQEDLNSNGALDPASEDITYRIVESRQLERVTGATTDILLSNVDLSGSRLRYFDGGGVELLPAPSLSAAQRAAVRRVRIEIAASGAAASPMRSMPLVAYAATDVELRNRFFVISNTCL